MSTCLLYDPSMSETRWLNEREARAWRALQFMQMRIEGELARRLVSDSSLSYADYVVLVALTDRSDGRLRQFELSSELGWEKSRLSHHISRMTKRGLVDKHTCPTDRRGAFVVITDQGRVEIETAAPGHLAAVRELFIDHLDNDQLDAIADIAETILSAAQSTDEDQDSPR